MAAHRLLSPCPAPALPLLHPPPTPHSMQTCRAPPDGKGAQSFRRSGVKDATVGTVRRSARWVKRQAALVRRQSTQQNVFAAFGVTDSTVDPVNRSTSDMKDAFRRSAQGGAGRKSTQKLESTINQKLTPIKIPQTFLFHFRAHVYQR